MEAISATDMSNFLEETTAGMAAARRRMAEVRRLKMLSTSGNYAEFVKKRTRSRNGSRFCSACFGEEPAHTDSDNASDAMEIEIQSQALYPARRLVRSVSTPIAWKGGLFCTCNFDKYFNKDTNAKQNPENPQKTDNPNNNNNNNSSESERGPSNSSLIAKSETMVEGSSPEKVVSKPACEEPQEKTVLVDVAKKVQTLSIPPLPLPSLLFSSSSSSCTGSSDSPSGFAAEGRYGEKDSVVPASRPLKGINRANSESISHLLKDPCPAHGTMSIIGRRREMEDAVAAVPSFFSLPKSNTGATVQKGIGGFTPPSPTPLHFFAVYDGHGGSQASIFCKNRFHEALAEELSNASPFTKDLNDWTKVMSACFMKMDIAVGGICPNGGCGNGDAQANSDCCQDPVAPENVGSTAVIAVVGPCQLVIANCGDSRAVLCRGGRAIPLSNDHKPDREDEMGRIEAAGGRVIYWNGYRVGGFLAMSRALGDRFLKRYVISEPEVTCVERTHEDECLILASDGLWDVLSNDTVCEVARKCLAGYRPHRSNGITEDTPVGAAAALLAKLALGRGSGDNVSVVVIDLKERRTRNR